METIIALKKRRSIRIFNTKPVPRKVIEDLVDCARLAATSRNVQPWEFVAVTKKETLQAFGALIENARFLTECNCCIAVFCQDTKYYLEDGCAATQNILIAATDLGLATCWVAGDKKDYCQKVAEMLKVPANFKLVSIVALGYSDTQPTFPAKRSLKEVLHWDQF